MDPVLGAVLGVFVTGVFTVVVALIARQSNKGASTVEFAKAVVTRLEKVETDLEAVKGQLEKSQTVLRSAIRLIEHLVTWGRGGGQGNMPTPSEDLHEYLDLTWWKS